MCFLLMPVAYFWLLVAIVFQVAPGGMKKEIAAMSSLVKSCSRVELNSSGCEPFVLNLATCGDLVASLSGSWHTRMGTLEKNMSCATRNASHLKYATGIMVLFFNKVDTQLFH